jgi:hypothetical protein
VGVAEFVASEVARNFNRASVYTDVTTLNGYVANKARHFFDSFFDLLAVVDCIVSQYRNVPRTAEHELIFVF